MNKDIRNSLQRATQAARRTLEEEFGAQLEGIFDIRPDGTVAAEAGRHLVEDVEAQRVRGKLVAAVQHHRAQGRPPADAVAALLRECAFTTLNRVVALKMLEAREIVKPCVSQGALSGGFKEFTGLAPGLATLPDQGYRLYLDSLFDELGREVRVLFDRRDPASLLWPRKPALDALLAILNDPDLAGVWGEDETIGWVYQYFNGEDERRQMRAESQAPRNSRELAIRNQFFTPRYVVEFLTDNTLGRTWIEMRQGQTRLMKQCRFLVRRPSEVFLLQGDETPAEDASVPVEQRTVFVPFRAKKDPRELRVLDPACGSGHFLLYSFDLLLAIYEEAWEDADFASLRRDFPSLEVLRLALPGLILRHNLHGVDIDPRAAQIAAMALWMRAQRAWNDFGVRRADRPLVTRTNIVVAEPMPGERDLLEEFCRSLAPEVAGLVRKVFEDMQLAGEAGTLLLIEDTVRQELRKRFGQGGLFAKQDAEQWADVEHQVYDALRVYAEQVSGGAGYRRRLFAEDAARGFAFIDVSRQRYDVVLMNPPFGELPESTKSLLRAMQARRPMDAYSQFAYRAFQLVRETQGRVGAITSKTFVTHAEFEPTRRSLLGEDSFLESLADFGFGVLEAAVETAAWVSSSRAGSKAEFFGCVDTDEKSERLLKACAGATESSACRHTRSLAGFLVQAGVPLCYWIEADALRRLGESAPLASIADLKWGLFTADDERFCRSWWEVVPQVLPLSRWRPFAKGGAPRPFYGEIDLVVDWSHSGKAILCRRGDKGQVLARAPNSAEYGRAGLTFSSISSSGLRVRVLPAGALFSIKGPGLFPTSASCLQMLELLNSAAVSHILSTLSVNRSVELNYVARIAVPDAWAQHFNGNRAKSIVDAMIREAGSDETSRYFRFTRHSIDVPACSLQSRLDEIEAQASLAYGELRLAASLTRDFRLQESDVRRDVPDMSWPEQLHEILGFASGRFDLRLATGERPLPPDPDPFEPLPACSPGMLTGADGLPLAAPPPNYPIDFPTDGILVDDPGHDRDIIARVHQVFAVLFGDTADDRLQEGVSILDPGAKDLRPWLRRTFFEQHIQRYSKSRRKAPIYWRLGTPSGSYSAWLYLHRFNKDTLHRVLNDHVAPKLRYESNRLESLRSEAGPSPSPSQRKTLDAQETFVDELRGFSDELERVAPLWDPDLDDGVVINASFLHRLFGHTRAWQKECESHWQKLQMGEYDWAHLAMRLWPERVVPKCTEDRSLAIAHGLENMLWLEGADGKWRPQHVTDAQIAALVQERTSTAVKDALRRMGETPDPVPARIARAGRAVPAAPARREPESQQTVAQVPLALGGGSPRADGSAVDALRAALQGFPDGAGRSELLAASGLAEAQWVPAVTDLIESGEVDRTGQKRGTRYILRVGRSS